MEDNWVAMRNVSRRLVLGWALVAISLTAQAQSAEPDADITALDAVILKVDGATVTVDVIRNDSVSQIRTIRFTDATRSGTDGPLKPSSMVVGRKVRVIGVERPDGTVEATRMTIYIGRRPEGTEGNRTLPMTGKLPAR